MKQSLKSVKKAVTKHLKGDIKTFKEEAMEDKGLIKKLSSKKSTKAKHPSNAKLDESLGMRRGKESSKSQPMKARRKESRGARKAK